MRTDLCFLKDTKDHVEMPLSVTGFCSGRATLMQKFTTLLFADESSDTRIFGGGLGGLVGGNTYSEDALKLLVRQAATEVYQILKEESDTGLFELPPEETITGLGEVSVASGRDSFSASIQILTEAGPIDLNTPLPINRVN